jgi:type II secretory pathway component PulF
MKAGMSFADAAANEKRLFGPAERTLLLAGERQNKLCEVLDDLARMKTASPAVLLPATNPAVLLPVTLLAAELALCMYVNWPIVAETAKYLNIAGGRHSADLVSGILISSPHSITEFLLPGSSLLASLAIVTVSVVALILARDLVPLQAVFFSFSSRLRNMYWAPSLNGFSFALGTMIDTDMALPEATRQAIRSSSNPVLVRSEERIMSQLEKGEPIETAMLAVPTIPSGASHKLGRLVREGRAGSASRVATTGYRNGINGTLSAWALALFGLVYVFWGVGLFGVRILSSGMYGGHRGGADVGLILWTAIVLVYVGMLIATSFASLLTAIYYTRE